MRRQDSGTHEIPSFARYLNKVFDFRSAAAGLQDSRQTPDISPQVVFLAAFYGFVFRLPSFQQLESDLAQPYLQHWTGSDRGFGDDVLRYLRARLRMSIPISPQGPHSPKAGAGFRASGSRYYATPISCGS